MAVITGINRYAAVRSPTSVRSTSHARVAPRGIAIAIEPSAKMAVVHSSLYVLASKKMEKFASVKDPIPDPGSVFVMPTRTINANGTTMRQATSTTTSPRTRRAAGVTADDRFMSMAVHARRASAPLLLRRQAEYVSVLVLQPGELVGRRVAAHNYDTVVLLK